MLSSLFTTALLATSVAAYIDPIHLIARQTDAPDLGGGGADCLSAVLDVAGSAPYPPQPIVDVMTSFFMTATGTYDAQCGWQTNIPASLVGQWYSYSSKVMSWYSDHEAEMNSALANCPAEYRSSVGVCTKTIDGLPAPANAKPTGGSGSGSGTNSPNAAAPMQTGYVAAAAAAAAGFMGVVAVL